MNLDPLLSSEVNDENLMELGRYELANHEKEKMVRPFCTRVV